MSSKNIDRLIYIFEKIRNLGLSKHNTFEKRAISWNDMFSMTSVSVFIYTLLWIFSRTVFCPRIFVFLLKSKEIRPEVDLADNSNPFFKTNPLPTSRTYTYYVINKCWTDRMLCVTESHPGWEGSLSTQGTAVRRQPDSGQDERHRRHQAVLRGGRTQCQR